MADYFTITEVSRLTGLASHTIRYYEKQFPAILDVERSKGGHRVYRPRHLDALKSVIKLLKEEKLSIRSARKILGEPEPEEIEGMLEPSFSDGSKDVSEINRSLILMLDRLDRLCRSNERRDELLESLMKKSSQDERNDLIEQIIRCRKETKETMKMYESLMVNWKNSN